MEISFKVKFHLYTKKNSHNKKKQFDTDSVQVADFLLTLRYYFLNRVALLAKLGTAYQWTDLSHTVTGGTRPDSGASNDFKSTETRYTFNPEWQLGFLMDLSQHLSASMAIDRINGSGTSDTVATNPTTMAVIVQLDYQFK